MRYVRRAFVAFLAIVVASCGGNKTPCASCGGRGTVAVPKFEGTAGGSTTTSYEYVRCSSCGGTGYK